MKHLPNLVLKSSALTNKSEEPIVKKFISYFIILCLISFGYNLGYNCEFGSIRNDIFKIQISHLYKCFKTFYFILISLKVLFPAQTKLLFTFSYLLYIMSYLY